MNNSQWLEILISRKNLISDCLPTPLDNYNNLYLLETINKDTLNDEVMLICDSSHKGAIFDYNAIVSVTESLDIDVQPVIVFNNWEEERNTYWAYYDIQKKAVDRKNFSDWYEKKISIYTDCANSVELEIEDEGINYLEYSNNSSDLKLSGRVYNISFFELKKLFNVTGAHLFVNNVRYGIKKHQTGDLLKTKFREYLCGAIYSVLKSRSMIEEKDDEQIIEILGVNPREIQEPNLLSENFWFYHNGVTIFCYGIDDFETPRNKVRLTPNNVSVINGAQTLTNFFSEVESIKRYVMGDIISLVPNLNSKELLDSVIRGIFVKTIIIVGDSSYVRPITHGLNTQIPILQEDLLANSPNVENINNILKNNKSRVKIIKEGESWSGEYGVSVLDFAKHWLTINNKPGNSKNLGKKKLDPILIDALETLNQSPHQYIEKLGKLLDIYEWWEDSKQIRYESTSHNASQDSIYRYGKNYFGAYTLNYSTELFDIDDSKMIMIYEEFEKDLLATGHDLGLGEFKKDDLTALMLFHREQRKSSATSEPSAEASDAVSEDVLQGLVEQFSSNTSAYAFSKKISHYLLSRDIQIPYFRVISLYNNKCKEAFPFPNSTFNELIASDNLMEITFEKSLFLKEIKKIYPVFIVDKSSSNTVEKIRYVDSFSFANYETEAEQVFNQTLEAFVEGDESKFPKSGSNLGFHIRPKAINGEDTFEFTNGNHITKRTFWANKDTVEAILEDKLNKGYSTNGAADLK